MRIEKADYAQNYARVCSHEASDRGGHDGEIARVGRRPAEIADVNPAIPRPTRFALRAVEAFRQSLLLGIEVVRHDRGAQSRRVVLRALSNIFVRRDYGVAKAHNPAGPADLSEPVVPDGFIVLIQIKQVQQ